MERRRQSHVNQQKKYFTLASSTILLVINISILICYYKAQDLLFQQNVPFWVFFVSVFFIFTNCFIIFSFYKSTSLFIDATLFLCVLLLIFQFLCGMIATCSLVIDADSIAKNLTMNRPDNKMQLTEMKTFETENHCCFEFNDDNNVTTHAPLPPDPHQHKSGCKSCVQVNKEKARNVAIFLSTGYILVLVMLGTIIMLIIS